MLWESLSGWASIFAHDIRQSIKDVDAARRAAAEQTREDNQKHFDYLRAQYYEQQKPKRYQGDFEDVEFTEQERGENVEQRRSLTDGRPEDPAALPTDNA